MHALQNTVPDSINLLHPIGSRRSPSQEHYAIGPLLSNNVNDSLGEFLPAAVGMAAGLVCPDCQAGVQQQNSSISPWSEQSSSIGWRREGVVIFFESLIDVLEGGWRGCRRAD